MITYEKAKQKALENIPNADTCVEYNSVYIFYNSKARLLPKMRNTGNREGSEHKGSRC